MEILVEQAKGKVPVTILKLQGELDGSNYLDVISKAKELYHAGTRDILLDMSQVNFMSSAGLVALHSIALLMRGDSPEDPESGWEVFHAIDRDRESGVQKHMKLLNPQPKVVSTLHKTGMDVFFDIHQNLQMAISSF